MCSIRAVRRINRVLIDVANSPPAAAAVPSLRGRSRSPAADRARTRVIFTPTAADLASNERFDFERRPFSDLNLNCSTGRFYSVLPHIIIMPVVMSRYFLLLSVLIANGDLFSCYVIR